MLELFVVTFLVVGCVGVFFFFVCLLLFSFFFIEEKKGDNSIKKNQNLNVSND